MAAPKPIEVRPTMGGRLMPDMSSDTVGIYNYTRKSEFRRFKEREIRSEGYDRFNPNPLNTAAPQPPTTDNITLVAEVFAASGRRAVVAGTKTTLWRYFGTESGATFEAGVFEADVYDDNPGDWIQIGSGFSSSGKRWEAHCIAGWLILNNGVDLPVSYRVQDVAVEPLWELREQGIASIGTIGKWNDILVCGDIRQINADKHKEIMSALPALVAAGQTGCQTFAGVLGTVNSGVDGVAGNSLTLNGGTYLDVGMSGRTIRMANGVERQLVVIGGPASASLSGDPFLSEPPQPISLLSDDDNKLSQTRTALWPDVPAEKLVGLRIFWDTGEARKIVSVDADGMIRVDSDQPVPVGALSLENPSAYTAFTDTANIDRFPSRVVPSMPAQPRRFAAVIPLTATAGSTLLALDYPVRSLESGQDITVTDIGQNGESLRTTILWANPSIARVLVVTDAALPTVAETKLAAIAAETAAQLTVTQAARALSDQNAALDAAQTALDADANNADLIAAVANASGKIPGLSDALTAAQAALVKATAARVEADAIESTASGLLQRSDANGSIVAYDDLEGDGSTILRVIELRGYLVVCKETGFFVGRYVGKAGQAFVFEELKTPPDSALRYKYSLVNVGGQYLLYCGQADFYTLDLVTRTPQMAVPFQGCSRAFFDGFAAGKKYGPPRGYTVINPPTGEIRFNNLDPDKSYEFYLGGAITVVTGVSSYTTFINLAVTIPYYLSFREVIDDGEVFAAENAVTGEVWFVSAASSDNVLRLDTQYNTIGTSTLPITSAATIRRPDGKTTTSQSILWFIMGTAGKVWRYGFTNDPVRSSGTIKATVAANGIVTATGDMFSPNDVGRSLVFGNRKCVAIVQYFNNRQMQVLGDLTGIVGQTFQVVPSIWHREGAAYDSVLESGMEAFGRNGSEKQLDQYVPIVSTQQLVTVPIRVAVRGALNPTEPVDYFNVTLPKPMTENLIPVALVQHYVGDRITVSGTNNPLEIVSRNFAVLGVDSRNFNRRAA